MTGFPRAGGLRLIRIVLVLVAVGVIINTAGNVGMFLLDDDRRDELCRNQHSMIDLQRLFLQEHAAIRHDLHDAGAEQPDYDQTLLDRIDRLIRASDCIPS